jgi:tetratricopeptide (TPR) repeat protein
MQYSLEHKIKKASVFENSGQHLHAIQIYDQLIRTYPGFIDSFIKLAALYERTGQTDSAKKVYYEGMKLNPSNSDLSINAGKFFIDHKFWNDAIIAMKDLSPDEEPLVSLLIAEAYYNLKEYELSKMHLLRFVISDEQPELIHQAYFILAKVEYLLNRYDDALKYVNKAKLFLNDFWELHFIKAKVFYSQKMYAHSAKEIRLSLSLNSKVPELHCWAGKIYIECEDFEKAEKHLIRFLELHDKVSAETYLALADALQKQNKFSEAEKYLNEASSSDPENQDIPKKIKNLSKLINTNSASDA